MDQEPATSNDADLTSAIEGIVFPQEKEAPSPEEETTEEELVEEPSDEEEVESEGEDDSASLAAALGVDEGQVEYGENGEILFNAKVNGEVFKVPLKELAKSYQLEKYTNRKSMELSEKQRELDTIVQSKSRELHEKLEHSEQLTKLLAQELVADYRSVNWEKLKEVDPGKFVELRQKFGEKAQRLKQVEAKVTEERSLLQQQWAESQQKMYQDLLNREKEQLLARNPEWSNPERLQKDLTEIADFLQETYGYSEKEIDSIIDHRLFSVIQDALAYRKAKRSVGEKLVKKEVPKFRGTKLTQSRDTTKARAAKAKKQALRKSGSQEALANALIDRM